VDQLKLSSLQHSCIFYRVCSHALAFLLQFFCLNSQYSTQHDKPWCFSFSSPSKKFQVISKQSDAEITLEFRVCQQPAGNTRRAVRRLRGLWRLVHHQLAPAVLCCHNVLLLLWMSFAPRLQIPINWCELLVTGCCWRQGTVLVGLKSHHASFELVATFTASHLSRSKNTASLYSWQQHKQQHSHQAHRQGAATHVQQRHVVDVFK
jgi:hypothetical protein